jgi:hypothetical protein
MNFDGEYITEGQFKTIDEAWNRSGDMGSGWFFYPFHFVVSDSKKTIIDSCDILSWSKRKKLKTIQKIFNEALQRKELQNVDIEEFIFNL